jgi:hypothetical protein
MSPRRVGDQPFHPIYAHVPATQVPPADKIQWRSDDGGLVFIHRRSMFVHHK